MSARLTGLTGQTDKDDVLRALGTYWTYERILPRPGRLITLGSLPRFRMYWRPGRLGSASLCTSCVVRVRERRSAP